MRHASGAFVTTERPPGPEREEADGERRILERLVPEIIKRIVEAGYEKITEGPENVRKVVGDLKLPKEALGVMLGQIEETKNGLYRAVAREVRDFLENTNVADELTRALTTLSFEIKTEIRFIPNDSRTKPPQPDVQSRLSIKRRESKPPPAPTDTPPPTEPKEGT
jgi:hypothetical protein